MSTWKSYISGPKWANATKALYEGASFYNLDLRIIDRDRRWLRETVYFEVTGSDSNIEKFSNQLSSAIKEYNAT